MGQKQFDKLADSTVAKLRTVIPGVWGVIVGQVITWLIIEGWIPEVAVSWQGLIIGATTTVVTGLSVLAVYSLARWVEARKSKLSRFVARALLVVLKAPSYANGEETKL